MTADARAAIVRHARAAAIAAAMGAGAAWPTARLATPPSELQAEVAKLRADLEALTIAYARHDAEAQTWIHRLQRAEDARTAPTPKWSP